jgi:hypothetical protein
MLIIERLLRRDREVEYAEVEAFVPKDGVFVDPAGELLPEYFIEVMAQSMAAVNGYDCRCDGLGPGRGFLVGIESFLWLGGAVCNEMLKVEIEKTFEFGPVTVMSGRVINGAGEVLASGEIKAWEEK